MNVVFWWDFKGPLQKRVPPSGSEWSYPEQNGLLEVAVSSSDDSSSQQPSCCSALLCSAAAVLLLTFSPPLLSVPPPPFLCLLSPPLSSHLFIIPVVLKLRLVLPPSPVLSPVRTLLQVSECNWPSRQAPSLHNLFAVCKNMHNWLKQNPKNVCVITCSVRRRSHILLTPVLLSVLLPTFALKPVLVFLKYIFEIQYV